jgi:hypothetical protein
MLRRVTCSVRATPAVIRHVSHRVDSDSKSESPSPAASSSSFDTGCPFGPAHHPPATRGAAAPKHPLTSPMPPHPDNPKCNPNLTTATPINLPPNEAAGHRHRLMPPALSRPLPPPLIITAATAGPTHGRGRPGRRAEGRAVGGLCNTPCL